MSVIAGGMGLIAKPASEVRKNEVRDPSFEIPTLPNWTSLAYKVGFYASGDWSVTTALQRSSGWSSSHSTTSHSGYIKLAKAATTNPSCWLVSTLGATSGIPVSPGECRRIDAYANILDQSGLGVAVNTFYYNSSGTLIRSGITDAQGSTTAAQTATGELHFILNTVAPSSAAFMAISYGIYSLTSSDTFEGYFDAMLSEVIDDPFGLVPTGELQDDFTIKPDGDPGVTQIGGFDWDVSVYGSTDGAHHQTDSQLQVHSGFLSTTATAHDSRGYCIANIGAPWKRIGAEHVFEQVTGNGNNGNAALLGGSYVFLDANDLPTSSINFNLHWKQGPTKDDFEFAPAGVLSGPIQAAGGTYGSRLTTDGTTRYVVEMIRVGNHILIRWPDNTRRALCDTRVSSLEGPYITLETEQVDASVDVKPKFTKAWADTSEQLDEHVYFDGDTPGAYWTGAPGASASQQDSATLEVLTAASSNLLTLDVNRVNRAAYVHQAGRSQ